MVVRKKALLGLVSVAILGLTACVGSQPSSMVGQSSTRGAEETRVIASACLPIQAAYNGWAIHDEFSTTPLGAESLRQLENAADLAWLLAFDYDNDVTSSEKRPRNDSPPYRIQDFYHATVRLSAYVRSARELDNPISAGGATLVSRYSAVQAICDDVR